MLVTAAALKLRSISSITSAERAGWRAAIRRHCWRYWPRIGSSNGKSDGEVLKSSRKHAKNASCAFAATLALLASVAGV
eukprot:scaffold155351_cov31-Tisochrysis_lutea.AAC.6